MTRFLTEAELRADYGDAVITSLGGTPETAILDAEDEALGYLRGHTDIPASPETTSRRLKRLVGQLAIYNLYDSRATTPFRIRDGRDIAIKGLSQIRGGELSIAAPSEPTVDIARPAVAVIRRSKTLSDQPITMAAMDDWGHGR